MNNNIASSKLSQITAVKSHIKYMTFNSDSQFWKGLLKVKEQFLKCGTFKIKDGC